MKQSEWTIRRVLAGLILFGTIVSQKCLAGGPVAVITVQPSNTNVSLLGTAGFSVTAASGTTMTYQWQLNGTNIPGATAASYVLSNVQLTNQGYYSVNIVNGGGTVASSQAALIVTNIAPVITTQPQSQAMDNGNNVTFSAMATGTFPLSYQWSVNGTNLAGATNASLTLSQLSTNNAGYYYLTVTNALGAVTSAVAVLTVHAPPYILGQPQSLQVLMGQPAQFSVSAMSQGGINYQWYFNGTALQNQGSFQANQSNLVFTNVQMTNLGNYTVVLQNGQGSTTSAVVTLTSIPNVAPVITTEPVNQALDNGNNTTFSVAAKGSAPLYYQWYYNGTLMSGATNATLSLTQLSTNNDGYYAAVVMNPAGSATSSVAVLTVHAPPFILIQPQSAAVFPGQSVTLSVSTLSQNNVTYQWYFNGYAINNNGGLLGLLGGLLNSLFNILGLGSGQSANQPTLTIPSMASGAVGNFTVVCQNGWGSTTSSIAAVSILSSSNAPSLQAASAKTSSGGSFGFQLSVPVGATYVVLASTNLVNWTPIYTNVSQSATVTFADAEAVNYPQRFYKVSLQ